MIVIVASTNLSCLADISLVQQEMDDLVGPGNWTIDIADEDRVLRVVSSCNLAYELKLLLKEKQFIFTLMNVFDNSLGLEHSLFPLKI